MRITGPEVGWSATGSAGRAGAPRTTVRVFTVSEAPPRADRAEISDEGLQRARDAAAAGDEAMDAAERDPELRLLRLLIAHLTGEDIELVDLRGHRARRREGDGGDDDGGARGAQDGRRRLGVEVEHHELRYEAETASFAAEGSVVTADGRRIAFDVQMQLQREHVERVDLQVQAGARRTKDPLMLNLDGGPARLTDARFRFDLDADGALDEVPVAAPGSAMLALDRDGDGAIGDGTELFGARSGDGFADLAADDGDGNGWIDEGDEVFARLRLWQPDAAGGGTLRTLAEAGVGAIGLASAATPFTLTGGPGDETLGTLRGTGVWLGEAGGAGTVQQVDLTG